MWCLVMKQPPQVFYELTRLEREAFITAYNTLHSK